MTGLFKKPFAKVRTIIAHGIVCTLLFAVISCDNSASDEIDDDENGVEQCDNTKPFTALKGTRWRLVGIVNPSALVSVIRELQPTHCVECYTLTFETDRIAFVRGIGNFLKIDLDYLNHSPVTTGMNFCEKYAGNCYYGGYGFKLDLWSARSYSVTDEELRIFNYIENNPAEGIRQYSLFKRVEDWVDNEPINPLKETEWRLAGIVDTRTGVLRELSRCWLGTGGYKEAYTLKFINNRSFIAGIVPRFAFFGSYSIDYAVHSIGITTFITIGGPIECDSILFFHALGVAQSFAITADNNLKIYSLMPENHSVFRFHGEAINNSYLLFKPRQQ